MIGGLGNAGLGECWAPDGAPLATFRRQVDALQRQLQTDQQKLLLLS